MLQCPPGGHQQQRHQHPGHLQQGPVLRHELWLQQLPEHLLLLRLLPAIPGVPLPPHETGVELSTGGAALPPVLYAHHLSPPATDTEEGKGGKKEESPPTNTLSPQTQERCCQCSGEKTNERT